MKSKIYSLLNIKPAEVRVVKQLFLVQFFLGVGTSFLFTSALTLFLATYPIKELPKVSLLAAGLLLGANYVYAALEAKLSPKKLLQVIILFSLISIVFTWLEAALFPITWLPFFLSAWNLVLYMVIGYAFWGMAAIIFNVRESKRIFSIVGSGDIPAKILGYAAVAVLAPVISVINVLAISIIAFLIAYYYLNQFNHPVIVASPEQAHHPPTRSGHPVSEEHPGFISRFFENNLILVIAVWSFVGFTIFSLLDYTFLTEIKVKYKTSHELASFLGIYFAVGRVLAMFIKVVFSSRVINRLGLANSLLVTPAILLLITGFILLTPHNATDVLIIFGLMVLLSEVLKSTVQEPAFFILFQPLHPHTRLKGHLITKGYTLPFALLVVGIFAFAFRDPHGEISIALVCRTLVLLLAVWSGMVLLIKKEYVHTLIQALKKGYFTGTQLFLSDKPVRDLLLAKTTSEKPKEVLFALELLERSGYKQIDTLLLQELHNASSLIKKYVLSRITHRNITAALPVVAQQLAANPSPDTKPDLIRALYYLNPEQAREQNKFKNLDPASKKAALLGLASRPEPTIQQVVEQEVTALAAASPLEAKLLALEIISAAPHGNFQAPLQSLLQDSSPVIFKNAMEAVGQVKAYSLWSVLLVISAKQNTTGALQRAILHFGDSIFAPEYLIPGSVPEAINHIIIKTAGTITGHLSTNYLLFFLRAQNQTRDLAVAALYRKKANLADAGQEEVATWLEAKLAQTKQKINVTARLAADPVAGLLTTALKSEIAQDGQLILQACALLYNRPHLERVLQLIKSRDQARLFNAIEMLELHIPKRYFLPIDVILEYALEFQPAPTFNVSTHASGVSSVIQEILVAPETSFNVWTKSVALYLIPTLKNKDFLQILSEPLPEENHPLLSETKRFVISQVEL
ncbi:hypothetical protein [Adhaeribacter pallidiroseus]|uniref:ADP,ATP carrier protein n=1 Tax=Adhaeribacter pallidiroseus TaxID=2072847 RepID=A0A369QC83_9BACT|nr:hypothetical protein [Adhaeribacter pallidiroseus]RDC62314.1 hypothetical protein AHMF7616_00907 [Adhaeribacter pallidiroseus]